ncbi:NAD+ synthase [Campylobacter hyointestinalis subsp. hyointestinalis]|uniref:NH(3)-dependent NAD(+) synthetase n=1 Tax=Campylobacter hyointestinalis subsp. hyointestinalis TaxID=91352 RepID=A0A9W5AN30_CAMHY|nr:NAD+ synthase [Campylobacter hyointestinalis]PPB52576.1 NAD+ synthase [Campylobacter hyointestinalis subsp. hyointestinalis]PPB67584.1 NAD+ synthase [Campylobacter hyointestinalis subsp. hyointestinalis]PPB69849.1 NAD+ synthase [Campylobacter hyointestinalis subsp. hyointestinalis]QCT99745.1 NAD+ synthase [Campylobacter hyointestinalis subsp. hyointestinalis]CUU69529.1 NAD+ synthetase [Campylobacter hyointestinalis subsp. hyointestinalis]
MIDFKSLENKLLNFLTNYLETSYAKGFTIGVSGGLDSAIVATLCSKIAPTYAILLPTKNSNKANINDALNLCKTLGIKYEIIDIEPIIQSFLSAIKDADKLRIGNLAARVRMSILYDHSAKFRTLVVGTSNKSERMLGYGTIYGDTACALNPIGEIYKSDLFLFAKYLGIDKNIIDKAPSADLWEGQKDEDEIGYTYEQLDIILKEIERGKTKKELEESFDKNLVNTVYDRMEKNKFKLNLPLIANIQ